MMPETNELLEYDGSFNGFLCCVERVFREKKRPQQLLSTIEMSQTLFTGHYVETDITLAKRVKERLKKRLTTSSWDFIEKGFASVAENREAALIIALEYALHFGDNLTRHTYQKEIERLFISIKQLKVEIHHYQGFTRFNEIDGWLIAVIHPKHAVLPYLMPFFCQRLPHERFIIYEKKSQMIGIYENYELQFKEFHDLPKLSLTPEEIAIQSQWRVFFKTVAIDERLNPTCQRNHLPKRFWNDLPEMIEST